MANTNILVIKPEDGDTKENQRLEQVLEHAMEGFERITVSTAEALERYLKDPAKRPGRTEDGGYGRLIFAISLGAYGVNLEYVRMVRLLRENPGALDGYVGGVLVDGDSQLYTKSIAKEIVFTANWSGCAFVGRPLVEGTKTLSNFQIVAQNMATDIFTAYKKSARILVEEVSAFHQSPVQDPELLVLHASSHANSNTYNIWSEVKKGLGDLAVTEIGLRNGTLSDCSGCPYKMCLHFGEKESCFYGGVMVEDVYPAVRRASGILMLCPNYNDAISANLTAFINRLTALFRTIRFYDKALFAIIVSGYSGSDIVAGQLIAALNMNKTFYLPGCFSMMETANNAGTAMKLPGIENRIQNFSAHILETLQGGKGWKEGPPSI